MGHNLKWNKELKMGKRLISILILVLCMTIFTSCKGAEIGKDKITPTPEAINSPEATATPEPTDAPEEEDDEEEVVFESINPFENHGALKVEGTKLVDSHGNPFQLMGMSTHGIAWFPQFVNYDGFKTLRDDWNTNTIRIAMYTDENGGYCTPGANKEKLKDLVKAGVDYANELGMYVIIDWHVLNDEDPNKYKEEAKEFFEEMSSLYKDRGNVIYEICNEPCKSATWEGIKSYADEVIPIIRANDEDAIIIVGTPNWSQDIDKAAKSPLDYENIMYALHFYAATHTDWLRQRLETCVEAGLPIMVSEFGMCDASGDGGNDFVQAIKWLELLDEHDIGYICWNLANKREASSVIASSTKKVSDWERSELSESGKWIRKWFRSKREL